MSDEASPYGLNYWRPVEKRQLRNLNSSLIGGLAGMWIDDPQPPSLSHRMAALSAAFRFATNQIYASEFETQFWVGGFFYLPGAGFRIGGSA